MADATRSGIHVEAEQGDEARALGKAALFCLVVSALIVLGGFYWLGSSGMLDVRSPDFIPLPHFFAFAALCLGSFFLVRAYLHDRRYRLFGTSVVEGNVPVLGRAFAGTLRITRTGALTAPITLRLRCDWRHDESGPGGSSGSHTVTEHLWEHLQELQSGAAGTGIPFRFDLPEDGLPSGRRPKPRTGVHPESPGYIVWTLRASSPRLGTDYVAEFEIDVRPGRLIAELSRHAKPDAAPRGLGDRTSLPLRAAATALGAAGIFAGGSVPTSEELRDEAEANARPEPANPFAGSRRPESDSVRLFRRVSLIAGVVLCLIAGVALLNQAVFGGSDAAVQATVVQAERHAVTLDLGPDDPAHKIYVSSFHHWEQGEKVTVLCETDDKGARRCRMESGFDRWLDGLGTLGVALVALLTWNHLRRRQAR